MSERVRVLERALNILEELAQAQREISVSELSDNVHLHVSTVHRLLAVLVQRGYAYQRPSSGRYVLGTQATLLSRWALDTWQRELRREARALLEELSQDPRFDQSANLALLVGDRVQYVDQAPNKGSVRVITRIGGYAPLFCTGVGKVLLAYQPREEIEHYLASMVRRVQQPPRTKWTITDPDRLRQELAVICRRGVAFDLGEFEADVHCVGVPLVDNTGQVAAAISLSGPAARFTKADMRRVAPLLKDRVGQFCRDLGWQPDPAGPAVPRASGESAS